MKAFSKGKGGGGSGLHWSKGQTLPSEKEYIQIKIKILGSGKNLKEKQNLSF